MASSKLCSSPNGQNPSNAGDLPPDAVYEILQRVPAKSLCRLRAVCRSWRSLLSDPGFAAAHRRLSSPATTTILPQSAFPASWICPGTPSSRCPSMATGSWPCLPASTSPASKASPMDPATAATYYVRDGEEHIECDNGKFLFGQVASTGERKAFWKVTHSHVGENGFLYEVCTLSSGSRTSSSVESGAGTCKHFWLVGRDKRGY
ncbi:unnamed protein product [Urochloa humidicola]